MARPDGVRQGRLVQLRPTRHARPERRRHRRCLAALKVGDIVPTHPGGGFEVVEIDPGRSLVLRSDTALVTSQSEAWAKRQAAEHDVPSTDEPIESTPAGLAASGAVLGATPQQFSASWVFVIEPIGGGRSRLIERFRVWFGESGMASHVVMPVVGFGVFVMLQHQMVNRRAKRLTRGRGPRRSRLAGTAVSPPAIAPATNGHDQRPTAPVRDSRPSRSTCPSARLAGPQRCRGFQLPAAARTSPIDVPDAAARRWPSAPWRARPRGPAVGDPPLLRHRGDDGRRHQPRGRGAGLRHARA